MSKKEVKAVDPKVGEKIPIKLSDSEFEKLKELLDKKDTLAKRGFEERAKYVRQEQEIINAMRNLALDIQKEVEYIGRSRDKNLKKVPGFRLLSDTKELIIL